MEDPLSQHRKDYQGSSLSLSTTLPEPVSQFRIWLNEAIRQNPDEANAMTLATSGSNGLPSARIVLLKTFSEDGFTFFSNYNSRKAQEIKENPQAALLFFWPALMRQVRICGQVLPIPRQDSEAYFRSRPRESQISACISPQSREVAHKSALETRYREFDELYRDREISCPDFWGGYLLKPSEFEFWQGQPGRFHDRVAYLWRPEGGWKKTQLAP